MVYEDVLGTIGNTPMVRINKINPNPETSILAKLEGRNPGGSIKDRIALNILDQAEKEGKLSGKTIIEPTSGNTGIGLAMIGAVKGYKVEIVMSEKVSIERRKMIEAFGAKVTLTAADGGTDAAIKKAKQLVEHFPDKYFMPYQFSNEYNKLAHYKTTAEEIWKDTNGTITHFVSGVGTSGTLMGVAKGLKENNPNIKVVEAHPVKNHYIQGLKNMEEAIIPELFDPAIIDESIMVESCDAIKMSRRIILEEGIFVGMSSGAAMIAALEVIEKLESGTVVCIFPDRGEKYLSTKMFSDCE